MPRLKKSQARLLFLPACKSGSDEVNVVVETSRGSPHKYKYDPAVNALRLSSVLGEGMVFPYDFGFVPSTLGADGDPLDVLLMLDHAASSGIIASARLIGVLEIRQRTATEGWKRNDRFLAVGTQSRTLRDLKDLAELPGRELEELEAFFTRYAGLNGKELEVLERKGPRRAHRLLKVGEKLFDRTYQPRK
ncbi:inorganic pyrophosphatase [Enhydrobacter aerosaccus]|uniref:inorganic diphosphatase n=1 Tax=Enhydrobacter aerosaccus TaxID=225324 RepID=A0A1T4R9L2_9HYPH|nr:inorganic diphosphatase [Enhydrobacter aerosaccus]SKA12321.1 inorganic pyrophosphatase [Enhydrobacter aerosaccus]